MSKESLTFGDYLTLEEGINNVESELENALLMTGDLMDYFASEKAYNLPLSEIRNDFKNHFRRLCITLDSISRAKEQLSEMNDSILQQIKECKQEETTAACDPDNDLTEKEYKINKPDLEEIANRLYAVNGVISILWEVQGSNGHDAVGDTLYGAMKLLDGAIADLEELTTQA